MSALVIAFQDFKERAVWWFLFPAFGLFMGCLHFTQVPSSLFWQALVTNLILVTLILAVLYFYCRFIAKSTFLDHSFGTGDLFFFYAFALGFPTTTFIVLFAFSLLFSLLIFLLLKGSLNQPTVPLAGLMSVFLILVLGCSFLTKQNLLYIH